jgi:hypothetical protein
MINRRKDRHRWLWIKNIPHEKAQAGMIFNGFLQMPLLSPAQTSFQIVIFLFVLSQARLKRCTRTRETD